MLFDAGPTNNFGCSVGNLGLICILLSNLLVLKVLSIKKRDRGLLIGEPK